MRILITSGSKLGGTREIAGLLARVLRDEGFDAETTPPEAVDSVRAYDAVIVGGGLYANRWHRQARRFVHRHLHELRERPVWFFSSGPLDDSASRERIPPTHQVQALMEQVGARGHATFGGRLERDARGFIARSMAREHSGDWRDPERIARWARSVAAELREAARPLGGFESMGEESPR
ncbi:flavodoxin domain-containing protein [Corallococcus interemptor]|uniref:flavodoxin domain-containing protein n=1 Tax=Corallococcus TaxID=83461 RepID=UPI001CBCBEC5|nr:flavodoxin domain-containing protein [Corallococcus sp. AS-1-6]MBZ4373666.1 flavodoxin domain-containing protein [Corallococcus sp. AS-1-6]